MSILIKGERFPNNCMDCKMASIEKWYECPFYAIMKEDYSDKRFENCPLVEIKEPHGRLIDAEVLSSQFHKDTGRLHLVTTHGFVSECIEDAPTVIEAEGEK